MKKLMMKLHRAAIAIAALTITLTITPAAFASVVAPTFATYSSTGAGSLNGVDFTIAQTGGGALSAGRVSTAALTSATWDSVGSQADVEYGASNQFTITFDSAVSDLSMYLYYWRSAGTQGYATTTLSEAFTTNASFSGTTSGNDITTASGFTNGILNFTGPVTTLTISGIDGSAGGSLQGFTLSTSGVSPVPLPAAAWLFISAIVGLTGAKRMSRSKRTA